jgi:GLPGLI family protein
MKKIKLLTFCFLLTVYATAQINSAKIVFERKTNLYKKYKHDDNIQRWIKEEDKIKTEMFELFISDSMSLFRPQENELREQHSWATVKNTVYQNLTDSTRYIIKTMWGEELHLTDTLAIRKWQITGSTRKIAGYTCRKAVWKANDSTRIYAWFSYDLIPSTGPESFNGLPGTILGLATEDGGVVYFAKKVELIKPEASVFLHPKKKKIYTVPELIGMMGKKYGHEKWYKREMYEQFSLW